MNVAASIHARLLNEARARGIEFNLLLRRYFFERLLYRLSRSSVRNRFVLKGAMLLQLWADQPYRATIDLDLARRGPGDLEAITADLRTILCTSVDEDDGIRFDPDSIATEAIRATDEYAGVRAHLSATLGNARERLQLDIGVADAIWPAPRAEDYPTILDLPAPRVLAYVRETVVAEKLEAMVVLGLTNSRIKDFFDVHYLASTFPFEGPVLAESIRRTFERRKTPFPPMVPVALTAEYWSDPHREPQLRAFARRARLTDAPQNARELIPLLEAFVWPPLEHLGSGAPFAARWATGGPWVD